MLTGDFQGWNADFSPKLAVGKNVDNFKEKFKKGVDKGGGVCYSTQAFSESGEPGS